MLYPEAKSPENHAPAGCEVLNYSARGRKTVENYERFKGWNETKVDDQDSGVCTPPLWRGSSPPRSPRSRANHYRSLSPSSKAQMIARGQKELMELVSKMPEGHYELTLKDLVELPMVEAKQDSFSKERSVKNESAIQRKENDLYRNEKKFQMHGGGSIDNGGLLLKTAFPVSWSSRRKKKLNSSSKDGRVSPKPLLGGDGSARSSVDKDWWKNRYNEFSESGGGLSSNSGSSKSSGSSSSRSSSRNSNRDKNGGCWSCIFPQKGKTAE